MKHEPILVAINPATKGADLLRAMSDYADKRIREGAVDALQALEENPVHVLVADADLDDMSAIELAEMVHDINQEKNRFTFTILVGDEFDDAIQDAFRENVDAFVFKKDLGKLSATIAAGLRLANQVNQLAASNAQLLRERTVLREGQLMDPVTGLGNRRFGEQSLDHTIKQIESRGGAACFLMIKVGNYRKTCEVHNKFIGQELVTAIAHRLEALVRPMDVLCHWDEDTFALVLLQPTIEQCVAESYERIFDGVKLKSYPTRAGYLDAHIGMSICASHAQNGSPNPATMVNTARMNLDEAVKNEEILVSHLSHG